MKDKVNIVWAYPDILNIHGGRGDIMAFKRIADIMNLDIEIKRCESYSDEIPFEWADIVYMTSGELKCVPEIVGALKKQNEKLKAFIEKGGALWAVSSSGAVLGKSLELEDGSEVECLGLLDMVFKERTSVWGDDLWFTTGNGLEIMGNQIQVADVKLAEGQEPFGKTVYGRGNCEDGTEGAKTGNVVFTNCLGPMLVKNPWLTAELLKGAADNVGITNYRVPDENDMSIELKSLEMIKKFIDKKVNKNK